MFYTYVLGVSYKYAYHQVPEVNIKMYKVYRDNTLKCYVQYLFRCY